jgi:hypothetical protein
LIVGCAEPASSPEVIDTSESWFSASSMLMRMFITVFDAHEWSAMFG